MSTGIEWESLPGEEVEPPAPDEEDEPTGNREEFEDRIDTGRWQVGLTAALVAGALGMFTRTPTLVIASTVGLAFAAYGFATRPPSLKVALDRRISESAPLPGEDVRVRITVENAGERVIPDLRVLDDVPEEFELVSGTPGYSGTLEPGDTDTYEYTVRARRGDHVLGPTRVVTRNLSGEEERRRELPNEVEMAVEAGSRTVPLQEKTIPHTGRIDTDQGGEGLEFHSTRQYQSSDPMNRIDWNRFARTNELTTINYREEQTAVVSVMVDVRSTVQVHRGPREPDSVELGKYAAERLVESLLDHNDRVGVALFGDGAYLQPALGRDQALRARRLLREGREGSEEDPHVVTTYKRRNVSFFRKHMRPEVQVMFVTPLVDDDPLEVVTRLEAHGHPVTVLTPDVTSTDSPGGTVSRVERAHRVHELRESGVRVLEWSPDEPLYTTMARAQRRWST